MRRLFLLQDVEQQCGLGVALPNTKKRILAAILSVAFLTLFIGFHITIYSQSTTTVIMQQQEPASESDSDLNFGDQLEITNKSMTSSASTVSNRKTHFSKTRRRLPQVLIIGVRKCGTRALLEMLFLHPRIQKAAGEVHFFDRDENYEKGLEWYRKKMPYSFDNQVTIEKSPSYFVTPEVPERVRAMNSSVKLLLILREPVTRAISDYTQLRSHNTSTSSAVPINGCNNATSSVAGPLQLTGNHHKTFEQLALKQDGQVNANYRPILISTYHIFVHQWLDVFPREQILIVNGDQLIEDPVPEVKKIESFLQLEPKLGRHNFYFNQTKGFYCMRNEYSERCLRESKGRKHPRVDPVVVSKLRSFFSERNQKLYELIGEDLRWPEN